MTIRSSRKARRMREVSESFPVGLVGPSAAQILIVNERRKVVFGANSIEWLFG